MSFMCVFDVCFLSRVGVLPVCRNFQNPKYQFKGLKGTGGFFDPGKVKIEFSVVSDRGECQLPDAFYWIKKYCF